jgi:transposase
VFEDQVAWLAAKTTQSVISELMRIAWRSVGKVLTRVVDERRAGVDLLDNLTRIGIDETSYRRGHRYLTVVVCHDSGRLVWAGVGRNRASIEAFLDELGPERRDRLTHVSCDGAEWIHDTIRAHCANAEICLDAFHVVRWAQDAVDEIRREVWNDERRGGDKDAAKLVKGTRWALLKNPENLTDKQAVTLKNLEQANAPLYRAYLLKEQLRELLKLPPKEALEMLKSWLAWASRSRLKPFVKLARTLRRQRAALEAMIQHRLTNGRVESVNAKIRVIQQRAFGFHDPYALISLAMLTLSGLCPPLPGRTTHS